MGVSIGIQYQRDSSHVIPIACNSIKGHADISPKFALDRRIANAGHVFTTCKVFATRITTPTIFIDDSIIIWNAT